MWRKPSSPRSSAREALRQRAPSREARAAASARSRTRPRIGAIRRGFGDAVDRGWIALRSRRPRAQRSPAPEAGFTLIEILVTAAIVAIVLAAVSGMILGSARYRREAEVRLETHHGLRSAADALMRDIRVAGACLPAFGPFLALDGVDAGTSDEITVRAGVVSNLVCLRTELTQDAAAGSRRLGLASVAGFQPDMRIFLLNATGNGETLTTRVVGTSDLDTVESLSRAYPIGTPVWALQERHYALDFDVSGVPMLTLSIDGAPPQPVALGVAGLDVRYRLRQNCPACVIDPLPTTDTVWRLVTDLEIDLTGQFPSTLRAGGSYRVTETLRVRPRNLLP